MEEKVYGNPMVEPESLKEFKEQFDNYCAEIMWTDGNVMSHKFPATIRLTSCNSEHELELVAIDVDMLPGCGCWSGITLEVRVKEPD